MNTVPPILPPDVDPLSALQPKTTTEDEPSDSEATPDDAATDTVSPADPATPVEGIPGDPGDLDTGRLEDILQRISDELSDYDSRRPLLGGLSEGYGPDGGIEGPSWTDLGVGHLMPLMFETAHDAGGRDVGAATRAAERHPEPLPSARQPADSEGSGDPADPADPNPDPGGGGGADAPVTLVGTFGDDSLSGAGGDDSLDGSFGDDTLNGLGGNDSLNGSWGEDHLDGGDGDDVLIGGHDEDVLIGGAGNDLLMGGNGDDVLTGGAGDDRLEGGDDDDIYVIGPDALGDTDLILDSGGTDTLRFDGFDPSTEVQSVVRDGDDLLFDFADGGSLRLSDFYAGHAIERLEVDGNLYATSADASSPLTFDQFIAGTQDLILEGTAGSDTLDGGAGNDTLSGLDGADHLTGGDGDDLMYGGGTDLSVYDRADVLDGGAGDDRLYGGWDDDTLIGGDGRDSLFGEFGDDNLSGGADDDSLDGGFGDDVLSGGDGDDRLDGGFGDDTLFGEAGVDRLIGGVGDDTLDGGDGDDTLTGNNGNDVFLFRRGTGADTVTDFTALSAGAAYADRIDLSDHGYSGFADLTIGDDPNGNAVLDLGGGDRVTFTGVATDDLGAADFSF